MTTTGEHKIYLLKSNILNKDGECGYKIGRTTQLGIRRFYEYPKDYELLFIRKCQDSNSMEKKILNIFEKKYSVLFKKEYFCGDCNEMIKDINKVIDNEETGSLLLIQTKIKFEQTNPNNLETVLQTKKPEQNTQEPEKQIEQIEEPEKQPEIKVEIQKKELIKIKSVMIDDEKQYFITDENDIVLHYIWNKGHMDWILFNDLSDFSDRFDNIIHFMEEDIIYDINDFHIFDTIMSYTNIDFEICNLEKEEMENIDILSITEKNYFSNDDDGVYGGLSVYGKIVYLFECDTSIENMEGRFIARLKDKEQNSYNLYLYMNTDVTKKCNCHVCKPYVNNENDTSEINSDDDNDDDSEINEEVYDISNNIIIKIINEKDVELNEEDDNSETNIEDEYDDTNDLKRMIVDDEEIDMDYDFVWHNCLCLIGSITESEFIYSEFIYCTK
jgi:hypothetical protein